MHSIFRQSLRALVEQMLQGEPFRELGLRVLERMRFDERALEVESTPAYLSTWLASPVCFEIAKVLRGFGEAMVDPYELAQRIVALGEQDPFFVYEAGGKGYCNGLPKQFLIEEFFRACVESKGEFVFQVENDSVSELFTPCELQHVADTLILHEKNSDVRTEIRQVVQSNRAIEDKGLLLLAMTIDPELDPKAFLTGSTGRQNVPWYLEHFLRTWNRLGEDLDPKVRQCLEGASDQATERNAFKELRDSTAVRELLSVREEVRRAVRSSRPELFLVSVLTLVREFWRLYNLPETRAQFARVEEERDRALVVLCYSLGSSACSGIGLLKRLKFQD